MTNRTRVPQNIDESITLGVTAGPIFTPAAQAAASLALGVAADRRIFVGD